MNRKILCVDDDPNVLSGLQRSLRKQFEVETAPCGADALTMIDKHGPYAVIVADMRMPGINGVQLLSTVRQKTPDSVRIMLTGNADLQTAADAVNQGHVYEFLTKPCAPETLSIALTGGVKQYEMVMAERELLENTLAGSVKVLTEILSVIEPQSFGRGQQLREYMRTYNQDSTESAWQMELGALLAPIGYVTIPGSVAAKARSGQPLSESEMDVLTSMPQFGSKLLVNIPRLEPVAQIVLYQNKHFDGSGFPKNAIGREAIPIGARILKVLIDLVELEAKGITRSQALQEMRTRIGWYDPTVLDNAIAKFGGELPKTAPAAPTMLSVTVQELRAGQVFTANVYTVDSMLVVPAGTKVTDMLVERLGNFARTQGLKEPLQVKV